MNATDSATSQLVRGDSRRTTAGMIGRASLAVLTGAFCLTGCGPAWTTASTTASTTPSTTPPPMTPTTSRPTTAGLPSFETGTKPVDGGYGSGNGLGLVDVRTARKPGFDRITFVLAGRGTPGFSVSYARDPREDGSGDPVRLEGTIALQVVLRGMGIELDTGIKPFGNRATRVLGRGTSGVTEIAPGGVFEGDQAAYVGLTGTPRPFRAYALTDPTRIVVDVRHR